MSLNHLPPIRSANRINRDLLYRPLQAPDGPVLNITPGNFLIEALANEADHNMTQYLKKQVESYLVTKPEDFILVNTVGNLPFDNLREYIIDNTEGKRYIIDTGRSDAVRSAYEKYVTNVKKVLGQTLGGTLRAWRLPDETTFSIAKNHFPYDLHKEVSQFVIWIGNKVNRESIPIVLSIVLSDLGIAEKDCFLTINRSTKVSIPHLEHWHLYVRASAAHKVPL